MIAANNTASRKLEQIVVRVRRRPPPRVLRDQQGSLRAGHSRPHLQDARRHLRGGRLAALGRPRRPGPAPRAAAPPRGRGVGPALLLHGRAPDRRVRQLDDGADVRAGDDRPDDAHGLRRPAGQRRPVAADQRGRRRARHDRQRAAAGAGQQRALRGRDAGLQAREGRAVPGVCGERRCRAARPHRRPAHRRLPGQRSLRHQPVRRRVGDLLPRRGHRRRRRRPDHPRRAGHLRADLHHRRRHPGRRGPRGSRPGAVPVEAAAPELRRAGRVARRAGARHGLRDPLQRR